MVSEVQPGSPAEAAGFKAGDELVRVGDLAVANSLDLERGMLDVRPGRPALWRFAAARPRPASRSTFGWRRLRSRMPVPSTPMKRYGGC